MTNGHQRSIEERLKALEDQVAVYQLLCAYGFAVDGMNANGVEAIFAPEGVYDVPGLLHLEGARNVASITKRKTHQDYVSAGCAHTVPLPYVVIDGDHASATSYHVVIVMGAGGYQVMRSSACRSELSRKAGGGWQIDHRQNILLDGSPEGPALLARASEGPGQSRRGGADPDAWNPDNRRDRPDRVECLPATARTRSPGASAGARLQFCRCSRSCGTGRRRVARRHH